MDVDAVIASVTALVPDGMHQGMVVKREGETATVVEVRPRSSAEKRLGRLHITRVHYGQEQELTVRTIRGPFVAPEPKLGPTKIEDSYEEVRLWVCVKAPHVPLDQDAAKELLLETLKDPDVVFVGVRYVNNRPSTRESCAQLMQSDKRMEFTCTVTPCAFHSLTELLAFAPPDFCSRVHFPCHDLPSPFSTVLYRFKFPRNPPPKKQRRR